MTPYAIVPLTLPFHPALAASRIRRHGVGRDRARWVLGRADP